MFQYFFGGQDDMFGSRDRREMSLGSGVLISSDGYVVTNNHVVQSRNAEITVVFGDKHELPAKIIGTDPATDIALVKVAQASQPAVAWGDSSKLEGGPMGARDRQPLPAEPDGDLGHRQRGRAHQRRLFRVRRFHSDRRRDQSGQFRAARSSTCAASSIGINTGIISQSQSSAGHRIRDSEQPRAPGHRPADSVRRGAPRARSAGCSSTRSRRSWPPSSAFATRAARS